MNLYFYDLYMYKVKAILFACFCFTFTAKAQYYEKMRSLRPGFTVNPWTVGDKVFQVQLGVSKGWGEKSLDGYELYHKNTSGNISMCLGLGERFELNAYAGVLSQNEEKDYVASSKSGFNLAAIGARYNVVDGGLNGISVGLQGLLKFPIQSEDFRVKHVTPRLLLLLGCNPSEIITFTGNIGVEYDGKNDNPVVLYALKSSFMLSEKLGCFVEAYNNNEYTYKHVDLGMYLFVTDHFQLDISGGMGFRKQQYDSFIGLGISYRFARSREMQGRWIYGEYR